MKKLVGWVFFVFFQASFFVFGHNSKLIAIRDVHGNEFNLLEETVASSTPQDIVGVCYGRPVVGTIVPSLVLPRCHSEFFLLKQILEFAPSLQRCRLTIRNENFPPCRLHRGELNRFTGQEERNPGIPCHDYLGIFARPNGCQILVQWPGGERVYE